MNDYLLLCDLLYIFYKLPKQKIQATPISISSKICTDSSPIFKFIYSTSSYISNHQYEATEGIWLEKQKCTFSNILIFFSLNAISTKTKISHRPILRNP